MSVISAHVEVDLKALKRYEKSLESQLNSNENGPVEKALKQWAYRYRSFVKLRFDAYSKGGGNWKPLARTTVAQRRKKGGGKHGDTMKRIAVMETKLSAKPKSKRTRAQKKKDSVKLSKVKATIAKLKKSIKTSILRNLGLLFNVFEPTFANAPGALEGKIPFGVRVGYGGPATHPGSRKSIADIAAIHNNGLGHVPKREIIVPPSGSVIAQMSSDMAKALKQLDKDSAS